MGLTGSTADIRVPYDPAGMTLTISAQAGPFSASRQITVPGDPKRVESQNRKVEYLRKKAAEAVADQPQQVENVRKDIAESKRRLAETKPPTDYSNASQHKQFQEWIIRGNAQLATLEKFAVPGQEVWSAHSIAEAAGDWKAAVAAVQKEFALNAAAYQVYAEQARATAELEKWWASLAVVDAQYKSTPEKIQEKLEKDLAALRHSEVDNVRKVAETLAEFAYLAGDANAYMKATMLRYQCAQELKWSGSTPAGELEHAAKEYSVLSGNRQASASLWLSAKALGISSLPAETREAAQRELESRPWPAWFPPMEAAEAPKAADLSALAAKYVPDAAGRQEQQGGAK